MNKKKLNEKVKIELNTEKKRIRHAWKDAIILVTKKGNVWALAVGVLIGSTFGAVVSSLANDIIMSAIAKAVGVQGVASLTANGIAYGKFISALLTFIIVAIFLVLATTMILYFWRKITNKKEETNLLEKQTTTTDELILQELKTINANLSLKNKE